MKKLILATVSVALAFAVANPAFAAGKKTGFGNAIDTSATQGSGGQTNDTANPDNEGQTVITSDTEGPKGQLKQDNLTCQTCVTTVTTDLPGKNR